jgi:DoxX-like family
LLCTFVKIEGDSLPPERSPLKQCDAPKGNVYENNLSRARQITGWVLTVLLSALFLGSASGKLLRAEPVAKMMGDWGLADQVTLIGVGEAVSALLLLIPRTHSLGFLLLKAYMGGAIVTHMQHGESYVVQSSILVVIWFAGFLRYPQVLQSFFPTSKLKAEGSKLDISTADPYFT